MVLILGLIADQVLTKVPAMKFTLVSKNELCLRFSPDGSGIPARFFYEMEYSGQQESILADKAYSFAPNNLSL